MQHAASRAPVKTPFRGPSRLVESRSQALDALYEASKILSSPVDPGRMLTPVLNVLASFVGLRHGAVALLAEPERGFLEPEEVDRVRRRGAGDAVNPYAIAATTLLERPEETPTQGVPDAVVRMVLRTGVSTMVQNVAGEFGPESLPPGAPTDTPVALLATPLREASLSPLVLGVLYAYRWLEPEENARVELDHDLRLMAMVATLMSQSLRFRRMVARDRERLISETRRAAAPPPPVASALSSASAGAIIGGSPVIREVVSRIEKVAPTRATVLLRGESGTGKELFAQAIHGMSDRRDKPFVKVNCAALSETLLESELFGHEKGSFTGATAQKKGRFELAEGGTLFLDEIGEISAAFQAKLLRALQEGEFERVGGAKTVKVDVRLVAATNKDLEDAVAKGDFRADLYFRICVIPIVLPPLRDRAEDIPRLAEAFLERFNRENGARLRFAPDAVSSLQNCYFPGNVRELENCVNRVAALAAGPVIEATDLACHQDACLSSQLWRLQTAGTKPVGGLASGRVDLPVLNPRPAPSPPCQAHPGAGSTPAPAATKSQRDELIDAMEKSGWVQAKAARLLGLTPRQIGYALRKHGVEIKRL